MKDSPSELGETKWRFRPDIEGLRALAVVSVLGYHAGLPFMQGGYVGVDVFFVISGFLITGILAAEMDEAGQLNLIRFYTRRARRLLPASALALMGTAALSLIFLPANRWASVAGDIMASAAYVVNWRLAARAVDYLASESAASPVQHYWSLAVEEQYYLMWPLLMVGCGVAAKRLRSTYRRASLIGIGALTALSLLVSVVWTASDPARAYFVTPTRIWELGLGAFLALISPSLPTASRRTATLLASFGAILILFGVVEYSRTTPFPSWQALLPTVGTVLIIAAGSISDRHKLTPFLVSPLSLWIGARSYSLYLWHWPLVVAVAASAAEMTLWWGLIAVVASVLPAAVSYRWIENPLRKSAYLAAPGQTFRLAAVCTFLGLAAGAAIFVFVDRSTTGETSPQQVSTPLTASMIPESIPENLTPSLATVAEDVPPIHDGGCHLSHSEVLLKACEFGDLGGPAVVLIGDSHAGQWVPTLIEIAETQGWHLYTITKSACPYLEARFVNLIRNDEYTECFEWNEAASEFIRELSPTLVITTSSMTNEPLNETGTRAEGASADRILEEGLVKRLRELREAGLQITVIRDTPLPNVDVPDCLGRLQDVLACSTPRGEAALSDVQEEAVQRVPGVSFVDMTDWICTPEICPAVVGTTLVWRDASHLTTVYARSISAPLADRLPDIE